MASGLEDIIQRLESQRASIEQALSALRELGGNSSAPAAGTSAAPKRKGGMSQGAKARLICFFLTPALLAAALPSTVKITSTPNPTLYGQLVTLTAVVSPSSATGSVTFYDGVIVLGASQITSGSASLFTVMLPSGTNTLWAYYEGDANYTASKSFTVVQTINAIGGIFQAPINVDNDAGNGQAYVVVGDFNGDGKADLVFEAANSFGVFGILLGNGDGTFGNFTSVPRVGCGWLSPPAVADFNGDGKLDLAAGAACTGLLVYLGNGDGTFQSPVTYATGGNPPVVTSGDFNGDGKADLVVADECFSLCTGLNVSMLLGRGDGTFERGSNYNLTGFVSIGDFNLDGKDDLVAGNSILLGNGDGTFQAATSLGPIKDACFTMCNLDSVPSYVYVGDFNKDGRPDLAIADTIGSSVSILLGNGDGTFRTPVSYAAGSNPQSIAAGDFNGDGTIDLAVADASGVSILSGNGDGTFGSPVQYATASPSGWVTVGAFQESGRASVAFVVQSGQTDASLSVLLNTAPAPDLVIAKTHNGNFMQGQTGAAYAIVISNIGGTATTGLVSVADTLPASLTVAGISGVGWSCNAVTVTCVRSDALAASASFPAISLTVNVADDAPANITNIAIVTGGGETNTSNDTASDPTRISIDEISQTIVFGSLIDQTLGTSGLSQSYSYLILRLTSV
jgi:uncharacterized repeat protein (TIGR01451 family)